MKYSRPLPFTLLVSSKTSTLFYKWLFCFFVNSFLVLYFYANYANYDNFLNSPDNMSMVAVYIFMNFSLFYNMLFCWWKIWCWRTYFEDCRRPSFHGLLKLFVHEGYLIDLCSWRVFDWHFCSRLQWSSAVTN